MADKMLPKMMVKTSSHEARLYQGGESLVTHLSHAMEQTCITGGRMRFSSNFGE